MDWTGVASFVIGAAFGALIVWSAFRRERETTQLALEEFERQIKRIMTTDDKDPE